MSTEKSKRSDQTPVSGSFGFTVWTIIISSLSFCGGAYFADRVKSDAKIKEMNLVCMSIGNLLYQNIEKENLTNRQIDSLFKQECNRAADQVWSNDR